MVQTKMGGGTAHCQKKGGAFCNCFSYDFRERRSEGLSGEVTLHG